MTAESQLESEAHEGRIAGYAAFAAALLVVGSFIYAGAALAGEADNDVELLTKIHDQSSERIMLAVLQGTASLLLIPVLRHLFRATKARRPELPSVALVLAIAGPVIYAITSVVTQVVLLDAASEFIDSGPRTEARADDLRTGGAVQTVGLVGLAPSLALGFAFVMINLHAMRAGLVSRFMGIIGIIAGVLYVIPFLGGPQIIQLFWLAAVGALFLDKWPGGRGPAWKTGEAIPWPSAAEQRAEIERRRAEREGATPSDADDAGVEADDGPARRS